MLTFLTVIIVLASILMILVVLVQKSKGGGLASGFSSSNNIMGVRKTTDVIEKLTWGLAGVVIVLSLVSGKLIISEGKEKKTNVPTVQVPAAPTATPDVDPNLATPAPEATQQPAAE